MSDLRFLRDLGGSLIVGFGLVSVWAVCLALVACLFCRRHCFALQEQKKVGWVVSLRLVGWGRKGGKEHTGIFRLAV
jgi:hypothetical protein